MPRYRTVERSDDVLSAKRVFAVGGLFAICFGILLCRAVIFHLKDNDHLERVAMRQYRTAVRQSTRRGRILDATGRELAIDVMTDSIFANPREIKEPVAAAKALSSVLDLDRRKILGRLSGQRKFVWVKRRVTEKESEAVQAMGFPGIHMMRESRRFYPNGMLAASVLGAVGFDSEPLGGVELAADEVLTARNSSGELKRDARGHLYLSPGEEDVVRLRDVELTIDKTVQYITERSLARAVKDANARGGTALVIDVRSGAILAMANIPTFDPNEYGSYAIENWKNHAIMDAYEPGSTFKVIVVASAIDDSVVDVDEIFNCENGRITIGPDVVRDAHPHGKLSVADIIKVSSNIGAYKVEQRLGRKRLEEHILAFGFGNQTALGMPGESAGILSPESHWSELQFATIAFGQGIAATPLQMSMAFSAIANGGKLMKPYIIKRVLDEDGAILSSTESQVVARPIRPETSAIMRRLLSRVTGPGGTGTLAASLEYDTAGKTGTAQKADAHTGGYVKGKYHSSFIGFAPAQDPRIVVYVSIDEPRGRAYYGGQVAAPAFRSIVEEVLPYFKVPGQPSVASETVLAQLPARGVADAVVRESLEADGNEVPVQPAVAIGQRTIVREGQSWRLPDFQGLSMRQVLQASRGAQIDLQIVGSGLAVRQTPKAGATLHDDETCTVEFSPLL